MRQQRREMACVARSVDAEHGSDSKADHTEPVLVGVEPRGGLLHAEWPQASHK
jgi:hypothetical protein